MPGTQGFWKPLSVDMDVLARRATTHHPASRLAEPIELRNHRAMAADIQIGSQANGAHDQPQWTVGAEQDLEAEASRETRIRGITGGRRRSGV